MWMIEGSFGESKNQHLLRRAKYRGLSKMQIQSYMVALAQNLKRMAHLILRHLLRLFVLLFT